jgi:hypothetical protein
MSESEQWFTDGTFKSAPSSIFKQIYAIHTLKYNTVIPVVFALLPDKSTATYSYLIKTLKSHIPLNPKTIMTDFERSAILEFKENVYNIIYCSCHFHLSQYVWRKIQSIPIIHKKISNLCRILYSNTIVTSTCLCTSIWRISKFRSLMWKWLLHRTERTFTTTIGLLWRYLA